MANRVSSSDVDEIMEEDYSSTDLEVFIIPANLIVTDRCSDSGYSAAHLKELERWLSAHFVAISKKTNRIAAEKIDIASVTYMAMSTGESALDMTPYGRQVKLLDTAGNLLSDKVASMEMFGATHEDITDLNA